MPTRPPSLPLPVSSLFFAAIAIGFFPTRALSEPLVLSLPDEASLGLLPERLPGDLLDLGSSRLIGWHHGGHHGAGGANEGPTFGIDAGGAFPLPSSGQEAAASVALGARAGYQWADGIAVQLRYDDLGLNRTLLANSQLQFLTVGMRYTFPYFLPMPFIEAMAGSAFVNSSVPVEPGGEVAAAFFGGAVGVGLSVPLSRHLNLDLAARDYMSEAGAAFLDVLTAQVGIGFTVGGPPR